MTGSSLKELNARSAPVNSFDVAIFQPGVEKVTYKAKGTGQDKSFLVFRTILVCIDHPEQYLVAEMTKKGATPSFAAEEAKFKEHLRFRMTKTRLKNDAKQEYIHTSIKLVVDLHSTKMDALMARGDKEQIAPEPSITVAACSGYKQVQRFDITALVFNVGVERTVSVDRRVRDITLVDGTLFENGNMAELSFGFFHDSKLSKKQQAALDLILDAKGKPKPLTFFGLSGKKADGGFRFETCQDFFVAPAAKIKKGIALIEKATELFGTPEEKREAL